MRLLARTVERRMRRRLPPAPLPEKRRAGSKAAATREPTLHRSMLSPLHCPAPTPLPEKRRAGSGKSGRRAMLCILAALFFFASFAQLGMLARLSALGKRASALEGEIERMRVEAGSLELRINQYHNLDSIARRAREMGMEQPDETQLRAVRLPESGGAAQREDVA